MGLSDTQPYVQAQSVFSVATPVKGYTMPDIILYIIYPFTGCEVFWYESMWKGRPSHTGDK